MTYRVTVLMQPQLKRDGEINYGRVRNLAGSRFLKFTSAIYSSGGCYPAHFKRGALGTKMKKVLLLIIFFGSGCDSGVMWEHHPYEVDWIDGSVTSGKRLENQPNSVTIGRVPANVIAVGINNRYLVAKQKNSGDDRVSYFYIDREKDSGYANLEEITQGPMSESSYLKLKKELGLPEFTKEF